jgi:circadian clock protein KaiC
MSTSQASTPARVASGVDGLDNILDGGFPAHRLYLVEGAPGTGKTTVAMQFLLEGARRGETGLYVTLSETLDELRAVARTHGWSLDRLALFEVMPPPDALLPEAQYTLFHPAEVELGETMKTVLDEVGRVRPARLVIDSLSEMRLLAQNPLRFRRQVMALKQFFAGRQCTVLLLDAVAAAGGDSVETLVHGVLVLEQLALEYGAERRRLRVVKLRGVCFRGGYHDYTIRTGGLVAYPRLVAAEHHSLFEAEAAPSGVAELDALLGGGLARGTSTLLVGPGGVGKSALATQYATAAAARGEPGVVFLFDEGLGTFFARATALGMDVREHVRAGRLQVQQLNPAEVAPGEFAHHVRRAVERGGARLVVLDSLNGYLKAMPQERFLILHLHELLTYLNQQGVTTVLVLAQHGVLAGTTAAALDLSYLADAVVLLRYFEASGEVRQAISVVKKRSGAHERAIREFRMGPDGLRVGDPLTEFQGVLTGVPAYRAAPGPLTEGEGNGEPG